MKKTDVLFSSRKFRTVVFACGAAFRACNREHGVKMGFSHRLRRAGNAARGFAHELGLSSKYVFVKRIKSFSQINT